MIEEITKGTQVTWRKRGFGSQPVMTGVIVNISYQDEPIDKVHLDMENPNDDIVFDAINVKNEFGSQLKGDKWFYASQLVSVDGQDDGIW